MLISCNIPQGSDIRAGRGPRDHPSLFFLFCQQEKLKPEEVKWLTQPTQCHQQWQGPRLKSPDSQASVLSLGWKMPFMAFPPNFSTPSHKYLPETHHQLFSEKEL